jgi:hypothetical protein
VPKQEACFREDANREIRTLSLKEGAMAPQETVTDRILDAVRHAPDCTLDELTQHCPDLHWSQIFLEVDRLSRSGELKLTSRGIGSYTVRLRTDDVSGYRDGNEKITVHYQFPGE